MSNMSIVNISLPGYNAGKYLRKSVESIHKQTNTSSELFIIDDGSTDGRIDFLIHVTDGRISYMKRMGGENVYDSGLRGDYWSICQHPLT